MKIEYKNGKIACGGTDLGTYTPNVWQTLAVKADTQNKTADIYINGKKKATIVSTDTELDLTQYLVDTSSKLIPRGSWLSIEIRPNDLAYVSIDMFVQGFVQSRGDATV